jgi:hypothetical protein
VPGAVFAVLDGDVAARMAEGLAGVYAEALAAPPHNEPPDAAERFRAQRQGVGGGLQGLQLHGLPHERAVRSGRRDDAAARGLYDARGWQEIGRDVAFVPGGDPSVILARRLAGHPGRFLE